MRYRPKHILEYILLRVLATLISIVPYRIALGFGWAIAAVAFYGVGFRRTETLRRMQSVFGTRFTASQYRRLAWISWRNTVFHIIDILCAHRFSQKQCNRIFTDAGSRDRIHDQLAREKGIIIAGCHMGNWDLAGFYYALNDIPVFSIVARQRNPLVNAYFDRIRSAPGAETLSRGDRRTIRTVVRNLEAGKALAILPDSRVPTPGLDLPFLGGRANLGPGMAHFARRAKVPILPIVITRAGWTHHRIRPLPIVEPDMTLDKKQDVHRMTAIIVKSFDQEIQTSPEQWFWFNKRWVLDPIANPGKPTS